MAAELELLARELWQPRAPYLNTASYGLPPTPAYDALQAVLPEWRGGASWRPWGEQAERARGLFATLVGVDVTQVAIGGTVGELMGLIAAALPDGTRVVAPDAQFTSSLFPFLVHSDRGVDVRVVALGDVADAVDSTTDLVVVEAVQSATGRLADLDAIAAAANDNNALLVVDGAQAVGWLPIDASRFDALVCTAYKWLMSPRGTGFLAVSDRLLERLRPLHANWYAADDPFSAFYGAPLRLSKTARRLDTSPAWQAWVGTAPAIEVVLDIGIEAIHAHDVALANRFRAGVGLPPGDSAIVSVELDDAEQRLDAAGIIASTRGGLLRASFHVYNTEDDVDAALDALGRR